MAAACCLAVCLSGCTSLSDYVHNGFKVGPNYCKPNAPVAATLDRRGRHPCRRRSGNLVPLVDDLPRSQARRIVACAYRQNLTLREAGYRVLEARATWPSPSAASSLRAECAGSYTRSETSLNLRWAEADSSGRGLRTSGTSASICNGNSISGAGSAAPSHRPTPSLDASVEGYDAALVTLLGDIATNYVPVRTDQERIDCCDTTSKRADGRCSMLRSGRDPGRRQATGGRRHQARCSTLRQSRRPSRNW